MSDPVTPGHSDDHVAPAADALDSLGDAAVTGFREDEEKLRLGGMALRNGLLVHGPTHWAAAVRAGDGSIQVGSGRKPRVRRWDDVPGLRGVIRLGEAMAVIPLVRRAMPEARLPFENPRIAVAAAGASAAGQVIRRGRGLAGEAGAAVLSLAPALLALRDGDVAAYHGVEHKAIAAYEQDAADAADASKEHERCGSHLVAPMMLSNVAGAVLVKRLVVRPGALAGAGVAVASTAVSVELFAWCERNPDSPVTRLVRAPGFALQRVIGTREPTEDQLDVGRAALAEILRVEQPA